MVVTVLELVPRRRLRRHRDAFVRAGLDVIDALAERLCEITPRPTGIEFDDAGIPPGAQTAEKSNMS